MKRTLFISVMFLIFVLFLFPEENISSPNDLSRLEILNFNYFSTPFVMTDIELSGPDNIIFNLKDVKKRAIILIFMSEMDPFNTIIEDSLAVLSEIYGNEPIQFIPVYSEGYNDFSGLARDKLGVLTYPAYFIIDHNFLLRGSAEGIYPDLTSEDFKKILDKLILDIKSPGIVNTLK